MADTNPFFQSQLVKDFNKEIEQYHLGPLWNAIPELMPKEPKLQAKPFLWKWETIYKKLLEAREIFTPERGGERRAIYLQNPSLKHLDPWGWVSTSQNLYAAVQLILPGETAPSHRHTQNALRFIMNGSGAYSIVDGQKVYMEEGDFVVTPGGMWHGHGHEGDEPMFWMDCLDIPFAYKTGGTFFENYPEHIQSPELPNNFSEKHYKGGIVRPIADRKPSLAPVGNYKWNQTQMALDGLSEFDPDPVDGISVEYFNPSNGQSAVPTISSWMQKLPVGFKGKAHRHTSEHIYHVFKGTGHTIINGVRFDWSKGDFFVIPKWAWHEHVNTSDKEAYLFSVSDLPIMEKLGYERKEDYQLNDGHQEISEIF